MTPRSSEEAQPTNSKDTERTQKVPNDFKTNGIIEAIYTYLTGLILSSTSSISNSKNRFLPNNQESKN
tara:strand:+ start:1831 stop:2034 length:204 start_codon:yes stop_codon:yes gene_type:complete